MSQNNQGNNDFLNSINSEEIKSKNIQKKPLMKETPKSLKIFFIVLGIWGLYNSIFYINIIFTDLVQGVMVVLNLIIAVFYFYIGIKLETLILTSKKVIINFLIITLIIYFIYSIYNLFLGASIIFEVLILAIEVAVTFYLIREVQKLAYQAPI